MEKIYVSFQKRIYDFLFKYTNNPDLAADLTQDTFLSYFKNYGEEDLSEEKSIMLLYTIARNRSINYAKKFSTKRENSGFMEEFHSTRPGFEKKLEYQDLEHQLYQCLDDLEEEERIAILLRFIEGKNLTEISHSLGISVSTASRLVVKATTKLLKIAESRKIRLEE